MKPEGHAQGCILRRSMVINPLCIDSPVRMWAIISLLNLSAGAITDHSQSVKDIESQLYVENLGHRKLVLILPNGLRSKPGERTHDRNFKFCHGWDSNSQPLDRQSSMLPLSYHGSLSYHCINSTQLNICSRWRHWRPCNGSTDTGRIIIIRRSFGHLLTVGFCSPLGVSVYIDVRAMLGQGWCSFTTLSCHILVIGFYAYGLHWWSPVTWYSRNVNNLAFYVTVVLSAVFTEMRCHHLDQYP